MARSRLARDPKTMNGSKTSNVLTATPSKTRLLSRPKCTQPTLRVQMHEKGADRRATVRGQH